MLVREAEVFQKKRSMLPLSRVHFFIIPSSGIGRTVSNTTDQGPSMHPMKIVAFERARRDVAESITADRAFDLLYHLCDALHKQRFVATSRILEDALDSYLAEAKHIHTPLVIEDSTCPPEAGERLRRAIAKMRAIEDGFAVGD
ncbi:hypothetical protein [Gymnodinialimonas hymeniacidonis]|uniref:hypothetical protein n=1 Tax=Gymnodinialimonas hymeniacidonis TaxID=3126508 RepID=UPI0034C6626E